MQAIHHNPQHTAAVDAVCSGHFAARVRQRHVSGRAVALALAVGRQFREGDDTVHFLGRRELDGFGPEMRRWEGLVVVRRGDVLKTTFQNPRYLRKLRCRRWGASRDVRREQARQRSRT